MVDVTWTSPAFLVLETLPEEIAFGMIRQTDLLSSFPEMGSRLPSTFKSLQRYRQLIFRRRFRLLYECDEPENCVYILTVQNCRQRLPTARDLKRQEPNSE